MRILLPVQLNPISRRKDKSVKLSLETRELSPTEIMTLMAIEGEEMWMSLATTEQELPEAPEEAPEIETKTSAQRLRSVLFILYKKATENGSFVGTFDNYYRDRMEKIIESLKSKIEE